MDNFNYLRLADLTIQDLQNNLRRIARLHLRELEIRSSRNPPMAEQIKHQMHMLAVVIQNLTSFYGRD